MFNNLNIQQKKKIDCMFVSCTTLGFCNFDYAIKCRWILLIIHNIIKKLERW